MNKKTISILQTTCTIAIVGIANPPFGFEWLVLIGSLVGLSIAHYSDGRLSVSKEQAKVVKKK